jgi:hypothetical protein
MKVLDLYTERERRKAIGARRIALLARGYGIEDLPSDWDRDLRVPDWLPPDPDEVRTVWEMADEILEHLEAQFGPCQYCEKAKRT